MVHKYENNIYDCVILVNGTEGIQHGRSNTVLYHVGRALAMLGGLDGALRTQPVLLKLNLVGA
jgi:hypothetical protein